MSEAQSVPAMLFPGALSSQGQAIAARLQQVFPPSLFQFKYLPANPAKCWKDLMQGNQPFLGLGFVDMSAATGGDGRVLIGDANWMLLCAVRQATGSPRSRFYGDAQGIGVLDMASIAAPVLQGFVAATGSVLVTKMSNVVSDAWGDDTAVMGISLRIPLRLPLSDAIMAPGAGIFEAMAETWNVPTPSGGVDIYQSDWENSNVPA